MTEINLPDLTGTEKQIKWAADLRQSTLGVEMSGLDAAVRDEAARLLATRTSARWWIETRDIHGSEWAHLLGVGDPALRSGQSERAARAGRLGSAWAEQIAASMDTCRRIRETLDAAGFDRLDYMLRLVRDSETPAIALTVPHGATSPMQDAELRKPLALAVVAALREGGWLPNGIDRSDMAWRNLTAGSGVTVLSPDRMAPGWQDELAQTTDGGR